MLDVMGKNTETAIGQDTQHYTVQLTSHEYVHRTWS